MPKTHISSVHITARINKGGHLILEVEGEDDSFQLKRLEDLDADPSEISEILFEVSDFYQNQTMYQVRGAILAQDNHRIVAYWQRNKDGAGIHYAFVNPGAGQGRAPGFVITATPADPAQLRPAPAVVGGGLPASEDDKSGAAGER